MLLYGQKGPSIFSHSGLFLSRLNLINAYRSGYPLAHESFLGENLTGFSIDCCPPR